MTFMNGCDGVFRCPDICHSVVISDDKVSSKPENEATGQDYFINHCKIWWGCFQASDFMFILFMIRDRLLAVCGVKSAGPKPEWNWLRTVQDREDFVDTETMIVEFKHIETMTLLICWRPHKERIWTALHVLGALSWLAIFLFCWLCMRFFSFGEKTSKRGECPCHNIIVHITPSVLAGNLLVKESLLL